MLFFFLLREASFKIQLGIENQEPRKQKVGLHSNSTNRVSFHLKVQTALTTIAEFVEDSKIRLPVCDSDSNGTLRCTSHFKKPLWLNFHMCLKKSKHLSGSIELGWFQEERTFTSNAWFIGSVQVSTPWQSGEKHNVETLFNEDFSTGVPE